MKTVLAESAGFCFGVKRAVGLVEESIAQYKSLCTFGPIIHNPQVVKRLEEKGVYAVDAPEKVLTEAVVIRSHGVGPNIRKEFEGRGISVVDATCPYVRKIQEKVAQAYARGEQIIIVGQAEHPEVVGINGHCENTAFVFNTSEDFDDFQKKHPISEDQRVCVVAQTTINQRIWQEVVEKILKSGYNATVNHTICHATVKRQNEAIALSKQCDVMIVVGGSASSNTQKLYQLCRDHCKRTYVIESAQELSELIINKTDFIGVTAGASTPDWVIKEVMASMSEQEVLENKDSDFIEEMDKTMVRIHPGQQVKGIVVYVNDNEVGVNIGYKSDGFISKEQLTVSGDVNPRDVLKEGDEVEVEVLKLNDGNGNVILSKKIIDERLAKDQILAEINEGKVFEVTVKTAVKGGLMAEYEGVHVFIPGSQIRIKGYVKDLTKYVGTVLPVKALEVDSKKRRVVASHSVVAAAEKAEKAEKFWGSIQIGDTVKGIVRRITDFGAFVDLGGYDGLLHIGDLAWYRVGKVTDILNVNDEIEVQVLNLDREKEQISLGFKQLQPKPWDYAADKYPVDSVVHGKVIRIASFGAFIALEPGVDGMVHISEIANHYIKKVEEVLTIGQEVDALVLSVDSEAKRISLSIKALLPQDGEGSEEDEQLDIGDLEQ